jgi:hypothetical protein
MLTALLGGAYLVIAPSSPDLAAASYRSYLFSRFGFLLWDNSWYGGHHLLAYSLLAPALGALLGPRLLAALSMTLATALFAKLIERDFPAPARALAGLSFAVGASVELLSSRVPFDLGLALGLASLLLARAAFAGARAHFVGALVLALLCALASPVAGAFLGLAFLACALAGMQRPRAAALVLASLLPVGLLVLVFPEGGDQPFVASAFYPALLGVLVILALVPREHRVLRVGAALYALALSGSYVLPSAVGGNADRLGELMAAPLAACLLAGGALRGPSRAARRARLLVVLAPFLIYWQVNAPIADFAASASTPTVNASFYAPLLGELRALGVGYAGTPARIEVVPTAAHWEARWVAPAVMIARGWERQLDTLRNALFYEEGRPLTAARYRAWLDEEAISYVALPDESLDYSGVAEGRLVGEHTPGYLREVWHAAHWRLFAVSDPVALAQAPAVLSRAGVDWLALRVPRAGAYEVRVRFSPYWELASGHGCVARAPGGWTEVQARAPGSYRLVVGFALSRIFEHGPRCS